jgi:[acyl-carrier-protein] S-malonyltransferase
VTSTRAIAFPGQGGDWSAAVRTLTATPDHPLVGALADRLGTDRWSELDGLDTRNAQPVVYVAGLVGPVAGALTAAGDIALAMGHSLGEITAAAWAGAIEPVAGLDLMVARGALGHEGQERRPGAMAAINRWDAPAVEWLRRGIVGREAGTVLDVAVVNSPTQLVLSGDARAVEAAVAAANEAGAVARRLPIGGAYHSSLMAPSVDAFRDRVAAAVTADPRVPVLSSTLQRAMASVDDLVDGLARSLVLAVDWPATVDAAVAAGIDEAVEAGPGDTLGRLGRFLSQLPIVAP